MKGAAALIVDDEADIRELVEITLTRMGLKTRSAATLQDARRLLGEQAFDFCITDMRLPDGNGISLVQHIQKQYPQMPVAVITAYGSSQAAVESLKAGAFDFVSKPVDLQSLRKLVDAALKLRNRDDKPASDDGGLLGEHESVRQLRGMIDRLARSQAPVHIAGESGTGKELVARALHVNSPRATKPFIAINTAAIPKDLLESEFFGHERGSFTGAATQRKGRFEQADGGTLFLDEIGDMPADLQTRLLRVLQNGEFYRVGGVAPIRVDVRVVAATHQTLETLVKDGRFREDLYHRLNVIRVRIPALRERPEDVPQLARHFLARAAEEMKAEAKRLRPEVVERLKHFDWPGNVRQLENICRWLTVMAPGQDIHLQDLPPEVRPASYASAAPAPVAEVAPALAPMAAPPRPAPPLPLAAVAGHADSWDQGLRNWADSALQSGKDDLLGEATPMFERVMIEAALTATRGQRQEAARRLGWGRNTLSRKIKELGLGEDE